jgi:hypothetical protein
MVAPMSSDPATERELGIHDERLRTLEREMADIRDDVKSILKELHEAKGGWRTALLMAGAAGSVGALIGKFFPAFLKP